MVTRHSPVASRSSRLPRYVFEWDGNHPALNFVNTLDERLSDAPLERLPSYAALLSFVLQARLIDGATATKLNRYDGETTARRVLADAIAFRENLHEVLRSCLSGKAPASAEIAALNAQMATTLDHRRLIVTPRGAAWTWDDPLAVQRPLWELAVAAENLLFHAHFQRAQKCAASDCGTLFLDLSKAGRRKWCSMANCGNRDKVRRFRSRET
jgi:predicted RNA-binding Zn ribbon-like protein